MIELDSSNTPALSPRQNIASDNDYDPASAVVRRVLLSEMVIILDINYEYVLYLYSC